MPPPYESSRAVGGPRMPQLVLQPCSNGAPRRHYVDTIENPVLISQFASILDPKDLVGLESFAVDGRVALWGLVPNRSESRYELVQVGASVLFVGGGSAFFMGVVAYKLRNPALAHALWGSDGDGRTWELMYAIRDGREIDVPKSGLNEALEYVPSAAIQGFTVKEGEIAERVIRLASEAAGQPLESDKTDLQSGLKSSGRDAPASPPGRSRGTPRLMGPGIVDVNGASPSTWVFQSNPKRWDLREFLEMERSGRYAVNQHRHSIRIGDVIWFRLTGPSAGLYGVGRVTADPEPIPNDFGAWTCGFELTHVITPPVTKKDIKDDPELSVSSALRGFQYTNAELAPSIASALIELFQERLQSLDNVDRSTEADIISAIQPRRKASTGQGFELDSAKRRAIELHAVKVATAALETNGWSVEDVGAVRSYDLHARRAGEELMVEVKGSTGSAETVLLTRNEVDLHRRNHPQTALIIIAEIDLIEEESGWSGRNGQARLIHPWYPDAHDLEPTVYRYRIPGRWDQFDELRDPPSKVEKAPRALERRAKLL